MIWLLSKLFAQTAPAFHFIGDHRYLGLALLAIAAAGAVRVYLPVAGAAVSKTLAALALALVCFDMGYSHRAAIDRAAWERAEATRVAAELAEHSRREEAIAKAREEAGVAARALAAQEADREKILKESENASHKNDGGACLPVSGVMRLNKLR